MRKLRLGVIGAGSWTISSHLPNLEAHSDVEFVIVNRRSEPHLSAVKDRFGFEHATTRWEEVLEARLDIVVVGSPAALHYEQTLRALESGAHVLCEKPFVLDPAEAWHLCGVADELNLALIVAFGWNYRPIVVKAADLMAGEGVGEIEALFMRMDSPVRELLDVNSTSQGYSSDSPDSVPQKSTWVDPSVSGGGYGQAQMSHLLGVGLELTGLQGQSVFASGYVPNGAIESHVAGSIHYAGGAIGTIGGASTPAGTFGDRPGIAVTVIGSRGMLELDLRHGRLWKQSLGSATEYLEFGQEAGRYVCDGPIAALLAAGREERYVNRASAELGAKTVEILDAVYRSLKSRKLENVHRSSQIDG